MSPSSTLPEWFERAIGALQAGDVEKYVEMYAPHAIHEFPFAPEGAVPRLEGRDTILTYMRQLPEFLRFGSLSDVRVRTAGDEVIIEADGHHHNIPDNTPRKISYVWFITRRDGLVTHFRDYMNPLQLQS